MAVTTMKEFLRALHGAMGGVRPHDFQSLAKAHARFSELTHWARASQQREMEEVALRAVRDLEDIILERATEPEACLGAVRESLLAMENCLAGRSAAQMPAPSGQTAAPRRTQAEWQTLAEQFAHRVDDANDALLALAADPANSRSFAVVQIFFDDARSAGFPALSPLFDALETVLNDIDEGNLELEGAALEALCDAVALVDQHTAALCSGAEIDAAPPDLDEVIDRINTLITGEAVSSGDRHLVAAAAEKRLGELLVASGAVTAEDIEAALHDQEEDPGQHRLGELLVECGRISKSQLNEAIRIQQEDGALGKIGDILVEMDAISRDELTACLKGQQEPPRPRLGELLVRRKKASTKDVARVVGSQGMLRDLLKMGIRAVGRVWSVEQGSGPGYDPETVKDFAKRAREQVRALEVEMLGLEADIRSAEHLNAVIRLLHQLKRVSGFLGLNEFHACAHQLEVLFKQGRRRVVDLEGPAMEAAFDGIETLKRLISLLESAAEDGQPIPADPDLALDLQRLDAMASGEAQDAAWHRGDPTALLHKRLGELLVDAGITTDDEIRAALQAQEDTPAQRRLGEILIERAIISDGDLEKAIEAQKSGGGKERLGDVLQRMGLLDAATLEQALKNQQLAAKPRLGEVLVRSGNVASRDVARILRGQSLAKDLVRFGVTAAAAKGGAAQSEAVDADGEMLASFVERAKRHLEAADISLLALEENPGDAPALDDVHRAARAIKRVSGYIGLNQVRALAFEFEKLLDEARMGNLRIENTVLDLCFDTVELLNRRVGAVQEAAKSGNAITRDPLLDAAAARVRAVVHGDLEILERRPMAPTAHVPKKLGELLVESGLITEADLSDALAEQAAESETKKLGELLLDQVRLSEAQLEAALAEQAKDPSKKLGDVLLELGFIDPEDLRRALDRQKNPRKARLGEILVRRGVVPAKTVAQAMRSQRLAVNLVRVSATAAVVGVAITTPYAASAQTAGTTAGGSVVVSIVGGPDVDTDQDGLTDKVEATLGTDPTLADSDDDQIPDQWEVHAGLDPTNPLDAGEDIDQDRLSNVEEYMAGSLPYEADSDQDGWHDAMEVERGTDPSDPSSAPIPSEPGDVNADGRVDAGDVQIVINAALGMGSEVPANVDNVGDINALDIQLVITGALN